jgi:pyridoxal phosphate enzyme (YggS family)
VSQVAAALQHVRERIDAAASRAGRDPGGITLVAVSKGHPVQLIREAMAAGHRDFGENRVREAAAKYKELGTEVRWHFVGRLQRNKVRHLVGWVDLIHSLDRPELAEEIGNRAAATGAPQEVLVEVNVSGDPSRGGVIPEDLASLLEAVASVPGVRVTGLMAMAPIVSSPQVARPYFRRLARLRDEAVTKFPELSIRHLSMGMSQDYEVAVEEGATLVRVGEAIFGHRSGRIRAEEPVGGDVDPASNVRGR